MAIKILPGAFATDPEHLARFEREAKTLASLNHPNIAAIYAVEKSAGLHALVPGRPITRVTRRSHSRAVKGRHSRSRRGGQRKGASASPAEVPVWAWPPRHDLDDFYAFVLRQMLTPARNQTGTADAEVTNVVLRWFFGQTAGRANELTLHYRHDLWHALGSRQRAAGQRTPADAANLP